MLYGSSASAAAVGAATLFLLLGPNLSPVQGATTESCFCHAPFPEIASNRLIPAIDAEVVRLIKERSGEDDGATKMARTYGGGGGGGGLSSLLGLFLILALLPVIVPAIQNLLGLRRSLDVGEEENSFQQQLNSLAAQIESLDLEKKYPELLNRGGGGGGGGLNLGISNLLVPLLIGFLLASVFTNLADLIAGTRNLNPGLDKDSVRNAEQVLRNLDQAIQRFREDHLEELTDVLVSSLSTNTESKLEEIRGLFGNLGPNGGLGGLFGGLGGLGGLGQGGSNPFGGLGSLLGGGGGNLEDFLRNLLNSQGSTISQALTNMVTAAGLELEEFSGQLKDLFDPNTMQALSESFSLENLTVTMPCKC